MNKNHLSIRSFARGAATLGLATVLHAQTGDDHLEVFAAVEVKFQTATNRLYTLQGTSDLAQWQNIGRPIFGNGQTIEQFFSSRSGEQVKFELYRLSVTESTNASFAPWGLTGLRTVLEDGANRVQFQFTGATNGVRRSGASSDPFSYQYLKTGENEGRLSIVEETNRVDQYVFSFTAAGLGTFVREEYRGDRLKDRDLGAFQLAALTNAAVEVPAAVPPAVPADLGGRAFSFTTGGAPDVLRFTDATTGLQLESDESEDDRKAFGYTYVVQSATNSVIELNFGRGRTERYVLTFVAGAQGRFERQEFRDGVLRDTDHGSFSPIVAGEPAGNGGPGDDDDGDDKGGNGGTTQPGDDKGGNGGTTEPGDDKGGNGGTTEPGDDKGGNGGTTQPGDDKGGNGGTTQPGDDKGGNGGTTEPGDDKGGNGGTTQPGDDKGGTGGTTEPGDNKGNSSVGGSYPLGNSRNWLLNTARWLGFR